jgi:hypothetical protein
MKKKEGEKIFEEWIREQIKYYAPILGIGKFNIGIKKHNCEYMEMTYSYPYMDYDLRYSKKALKAWEDGYLKRDRVLHELCHIITDPLYGKALERCITKEGIEDERERLTDHLAMIVKDLT